MSRHSSWSPIITNTLFAAIFQMEASKCYNSHNNDSNVHNEFSVRDLLAHSAFSNSIFRSAIFNAFKNRVNSWEITHDNLYAEESVGVETTHSSALTPVLGRLKSMQSDDKKLSTRTLC